MEVIVNGRATTIEADGISLAQLLRQEGFSGVGQAVAVNNRVVPRSEWDKFVVGDGMKLTVIRAVCGG